MIRVDSTPQVRFGWPVDGHVHFHRLAAVGPTLDAAAANFRSAGPQTEGWLGAVLLTQTSGERVFEALQSGSTIDGWKLSAPELEPESLIARKGTSSLAVVCGRQVRAADGLEILALGTLETFPDGLPFEEAVIAVRRSGALTVIPWGFGKWFGKRGKRVKSLLTTLGTHETFVGDNGSRINLFGKPALIRASERRGFRLLPGTDPFPVNGDHRRVGRLGFLVDTIPSAAAPWKELRTWLLERTLSPVPYGTALSPIAFLRNQVGIRLH